MGLGARAEVGVDGTSVFMAVVVMISGPPVLYAAYVRLRQLTSLLDRDPIADLDD